MGIFTVEQLSVLCEIADIKELHGIELKEYIFNSMKDEILLELEEHGIIKDEKLSESGILYLKILEEYSKAEEYIRVNNIYLCKQKDYDNLLIGIKVIISGVFKVGVLQKGEFIKGLVVDNSFEKVEYSKKRKKLIKEEEVIKIINTKYKNEPMIAITKYNSNKEVKGIHLTFINDEMINVYDNRLKEVMYIGSEKIKEELATILQ